MEKYVEHIEALQEFVLSQPPSQWCQLFFLSAAGGVVALQALPRSVRSAFMDYGARSASSTASNDDSKAKSSGTVTKGGDKEKPARASALASLTRKIASVGQVPHSWFWHFYLLSVSMSAFWAWQFSIRGNVLGSLAEWEAKTARPPAPGQDVDEAKELGRVFTAWVMMALQGLRRLYECGVITKAGAKSPMWIVHWGLGLAFYTVMSVSIWIQGSGAILYAWKTQQVAEILTSRVPSAMAVYFWAWSKQHACHVQLASLKKYTLPSEGLFQFLICPHYTCECLIYLSIAFIAAPAGSFFNGPILCGFVFVLANLGATARGTRKWYGEKFGKDKIASRWTMIPFVF